ncbi:hypothetical protein [Cetobacterium sp.]|uniref:hypothetical protein n=1 Tax=Cetobacterium sp. TaxID=2071632 RepID=UPI003F2ACCDD
MTEEKALRKLKIIKSFLEEEINQKQHENLRLATYGKVGASLEIQKILETEKNRAKINTMELILTMIGNIE